MYILMYYILYMYMQALYVCIMHDTNETKCMGILRPIAS